MARERRSLFALPLIVLACSLLGGLYGPRALGAGETDSAGAKEAALPEDVSLFAKALAPFLERHSAKSSSQGAIPVESHEKHSN